MKYHAMSGSWIGNVSGSTEYLFANSTLLTTFFLCLPAPNWTQVNLAVNFVIPGIFTASQLPMPPEVPNLSYGTLWSLEVDTFPERNSVYGGHGKLAFGLYIRDSLAIFE